MNAEVPRNVKKSVALGPMPDKGWLVAPTLICLLNNTDLAECIQQVHALPHKHLNLPWPSGIFLGL